MTESQFLNAIRTIEGQLGKNERVFQIIDRWIAQERLSDADREWLNERCGAKFFHVGPQDLTGQQNPVTERYVTQDGVKGRWSQQEILQAAAAHLFLDFLLEQFRKPHNELRPRIKRCEVCKSIFRTAQGHPDRIHCSNVCWQRARATQGTKSKRGSPRN